MVFLMNTAVRFMLSTIEVIGAILLSALSFWLMVSVLFYEGAFPYDLVPVWP